MTIELPEPARTYFEASNLGDIERMIAHFATDARVKDEGAEIVGRTAIRGWMEETTRNTARSQSRNASSHQRTAQRRT